MFSEIKMSKSVKKALDKGREQLNDRLGFGITSKDIDKVFDAAMENLDTAMDSLDKVFEQTADNVNAILSVIDLPSFPPCNMYVVEKEVDPITFQPLKTPTYYVQLAVSGYKSEDVSVNIQTENATNYLVIESKGINDKRPNITWYQHGIAGRAFKSCFKLANNVKVLSATIADGLLTVRLSVIAPVEKPTVENIPVTKG